MKKIRVVFMVLVILTLGLGRFPGTQATAKSDNPQKPRITSEQNIRPSGKLGEPRIAKKEAEESQYAPGELIVKLKEGQTPEDLKELNEKYNVTSAEKVFKDTSNPEEILKQLKDKLAKLSEEHERWYWQLDKDLITLSQWRKDGLPLKMLRHLLTVLTSQKSRF